MKRAYAFLTILLLAACASLPDNPKDAIFETKLTVAGAQTVFESNLDAGLYTPSQAASKLRQLEGYWKDIKDAEALLALGKGLEAKSKADIVKRLAEAFKRELNERAVK